MDETSQVELTGILTTAKDARLPLARTVVVFLHGMWQHKNIAFLKDFGQRIPADLAFQGLATFRFDCQGLGESEGVTSFAPHRRNLSNLIAAVRFLEQQGLSVACIYGYSAGGNVALMYGAEENPRKPAPVPLFVSSSARFDMQGIADTLAEEEQAGLREKGHFVFRYKRRGKEVAHEVSSDDVQEFASIDMHLIARQIPRSTVVLVTHGLKDERVPPCDASGFSSGIHSSTLVLIEDATHGYAGEDVRQQLYTAFKEWFITHIDIVFDSLSNRASSL